MLTSVGVRLILICILNIPKKPVSLWLLSNIKTIDRNRLIFKISRVESFFHIFSLDQINLDSFFEKVFAIQIFWQI